MQSHDRALGLAVDLVFSGIEEGRTGGVSGTVHEPKK